jgi:hypothetical protein
MATSALANFLPLRLAAGPDTPPEQASLVGTIMMLPPEYLTSMGSGPNNPGVLFANTANPIRGYYEAAGPTGHRWVIGALFGTAALAALDALPVDHALPGEPGWMDTSGTPASPRQVYLAAGRRLRQDFNLPGPDVLDALTQLYTAARTNRDAQIASIPG